MTQVTDRRAGEDRRKSFQTQPFPFRDSSGLLITYNRRRQPDRRLSSINVVWINENMQSA